MDKVYALVQTLHFDTFRDEMETARQTYAIYATRELAEEARLKYYGYCSVVEMEVQTKVSEPEGYWDWDDEEEEAN